MRVDCLTDDVLGTEIGLDARAPEPVDPLLGVTDHEDATVGDRDLPPVGLARLARHRRCARRSRSGWGRCPGTRPAAAVGRCRAAWRAPLRCGASKSRARTSRSWNSSRPERRRSAASDSTRCAHQWVTWRRHWVTISALSFMAASTTSRSESRTALGSGRPSWPWTTSAGPEPFERGEGAQGLVHVSGVEQRSQQRLGLGDHREQLVRRLDAAGAELQELEQPRLDDLRLGTVMAPVDCSGCASRAGPSPDQAGGRAVGRA